ncbi:MAG: histidine kinase [Coriobacteriia bacterium]|nr:histidine kinase [Coriobacteriia bacterium]
MKPFYTQQTEPPIITEEMRDSSSISCVHGRALIAVYDAAGAAPRVEEICPTSVNEYIEALASRVYELAREQGSTIPYTVIREVTENFIHANFAEPVVSILDSGRTVRFADQGPGISDKQRAVLPGFTTARGAMKQYIRGVGSGLPIVSDYLSFSGGSLIIEDNLGSGSVVTIRTAAPQVSSTDKQVFSHEDTNGTPADEPCQSQLVGLNVNPRLSTRQKNVLALVLESGLAGPSLVAKELRVGISTAYRDLAFLEEIGLISSDGGKRALTTQGLSYIDELTGR